MRNKKNGFTLAEILITLGILGVVAALTLPTFTANTRYQAMAAKISATISSVENGFTTMLSTEAAEDLTDTGFYRALHPSAGNANYDTATGELAKYLKLERTTQPNVTYKTLSDADATVNPNITYQLKNGSILMYQDAGDPDATAQISENDAVSNGGSVTRFIARIDIDVNGSEKPNKYGRDVFRFGLGDNGHLYAYGSKNYSLVTAGDADSRYWRNANAPDTSKCSDAHKDIGCTARLIDDNFKINF